MADDNKNDIRIMFHIINTLTWLAPGILVFACSISMLIYSEDTLRDDIKAFMVALLFSGLILVGIGAVGYVSAVSEKKFFLGFYSSIMAVAIISHVCRCFGFGLSHRDVVESCLTIPHLIATVMAFALAIQLARRAHQQADEGMVLNPAPTMYSLRM